MTRRKLILVGSPSRGVVTGLSAQFDALVAGLDSRRHPFVVVDRNRTDGPTAAGTFGFLRAWRTLRLLLEFYARLPGAGFVYLTVGSSRMGFLRDSLMITPSVLAGRRVVILLHGGGYKDFHAAQPGWLRWAIARTLSQVQVIFVNGELLRDQFWFVREAKQRIRVAPNGVPVPEPPSRPRGLEPGAPVRMLYLSNLLESKGYLDVLAACAILKERMGRPFQCDFCGAFVRTRYDTQWAPEEELRRQFLERIRDLGLEGNVRFHGPVGGREKRSFFETAHVFLLPTSYSGEGQPVSIIEAMSFGIPVVTTRYRGIPELVEDGRSGVFVEAHAPQQIASAVEEITRTPESYRRFSTNSLERFAERFTERAHVETVLSGIYGEPAPTAGAGPDAGTRPH